jgi:hypothetical protein
MVPSVSIGRTIRSLAGISFLTQTIWFDPTISGCLPTAYTYAKNPLTIYALLLYLLPIVGIGIFIGIWKSQSWAWIMAMILSLFVLFQLRVYWKAGQLSQISFLQIAATLICCIMFFVAARMSAIRRKDAIAMIIALIAGIFHRYPLIMIGQFLAGWRSGIIPIS